MDGPLWVFFSKHQNTTQRQTSLPLGPFSGYTRGQIAQRQTSLPLGPFSGYTRGQTTQRRQAFPWEWERSTNTGSVAATIMLMTTIATPSNIPPTATYPQANTSDVSTLISWGGLAGEKYGGSSWSRNREWWGGGVQSGQSCCAMWCWPRSTNSHCMSMWMSMIWLLIFCVFLLLVLYKRLHSCIGQAACSPQAWRQDCVVHSWIWEYIT